MNVNHQFVNFTLKNNNETETSATPTQILKKKVWINT